VTALLATAHLTTRVSRQARGVLALLSAFCVFAVG